MVAHTLKVGYRVQVLADHDILLLCKLKPRYLNKICTKLILVAVDELLLLLHLGKAVLSVFIHKRQRIGDILHDAACHGVYDLAALLNRERRMSKEALLQKVHIAQALEALLVVLDKERNELLDKSGHGCKYHDDDDPEKCVYECDAHRRHGAVHKIKVRNGVDRIEYNADDDNAEKVYDEIRKRGALTVCACAHCRQ